MPYKRLISYLSGLLAFDYTITCTNATEDDYKIGKNKNAYQKELDKVYDFLDKFNVKKEFAGVTRQLLRNDAFFFCFVDHSHHVASKVDNLFQVARADAKHHRKTRGYRAQKPHVRDRYR